MVPKRETPRIDEKVTLKEFLSDKIDALEEKMDTIFELNKLAIEKSELSMTNKLESMNEWRGQSKDQMATYATKNELDGLVNETHASIKRLEISEAKLDGKASQQTVTTVTVISVLGIVVGAVSLALRIFAR